MKALQVANIPVGRAQQVNTLPMQASTIPASTTTTTQIDMGEMMNLMITMMIIVMMMKMMTGAMSGLAD